jgi:hypothetical protein
MAPLVTGIVPSGIDVVSALRGAGLPLEPLIEISVEEASLTDTVPRPRGGDILMGTTGTGTGVPGLTSSGTRGLPRVRPLPAHEHLRDRLGALEIRDDEVENYLDALDAGRTVIGYAAPAEGAERAANVLRAAGVAKVKIGG